MLFLLVLIFAASVMAVTDENIDLEFYSKIVKCNLMFTEFHYRKQIMPGLALKNDGIH